MSISRNVAFAVPPGGKIGGVPHVVPDLRDTGEILEFVEWISDELDKDPDIVVVIVNDLRLDRFELTDKGKKALENEATEGK